eukprot:TRINITY_DN8753_c0_g1_i1.p1 TRINITY_DN8753_c0_g1~~TRINITY_DN8753_c0_g1_i1.p1  ORF type:complete len:448 (+),score=186.67 TRINITY_DN8753_c0_g1_i1:44-1387(+)
MAATNRIHLAAAAEAAEKRSLLVKSGKRKTVNGGDAPARPPRPLEELERESEYKQNWRHKCVRVLRAVSRADGATASALLADIAVADSVAEGSEGGWSSAGRALTAVHVVHDCCRASAIVDDVLLPAVSADGDMPVAAQTEARAFLLSAKADWLRRALDAAVGAAASAQAERGALPVHRFGGLRDPAGDVAVPDPPATVAVDAAHAEALEVASQLPVCNRVRLRAFLRAVRWRGRAAPEAAAATAEAGLTSDDRVAAAGAARDLMLALAFEQAFCSGRVEERVRRERIVEEEAEAAAAHRALIAALRHDDDVRTGLAAAVAAEAEGRYDLIVQWEVQWQRLQDLADVAVSAARAGAEAAAVRLQNLWRALKTGAEGRVARRRKMRAALDAVRADSLRACHEYLAARIAAHYSELEKLGEPPADPSQRPALRYADEALARGDLKKVPV